MLMSTHDGAVDHRMLVVCVGCQMMKNLLPDSGFGQTTEASTHLHAIAKSLRQVTPRQARAIAMQNSLDKQAIVPGRHAHRPSPPRQQVSDTVPLVVVKSVRRIGLPR